MRVYLGADASGAYTDNIHFHGKAVFGNVYGSGAAIVGGHYYQIPGTTNKGFVNINRRINGIANASFHVLDGYAVFHDAASDSDRYDSVTGKKAIDNCSFYTQGDATLLYAYGTATTPKFTNCEFYGVKAEIAPESVGSVNVTDATNVTTGLTANYKTVTWLDGTTTSYIAENEAAAKAFVEGYARLRADRAPMEEMRGNELYAAVSPVEVYTYDASFNATEVDASVFEKVYYVTKETLTSGVSTTVYHLSDDVATYLSYFNTGDRGDGTNVGALSKEVLSLKTTARIDITLYEDVTTAKFNMNIMNSTRQFYGVPVYLDLNGHTVTTTQTSYIDTQAAAVRVYSSVPGAHWYQTASPSMFRANDDGSHILGNTVAGGPYADNISFHGKCIFHDIHGGGEYIYGGMFYQTAASAYDGFINISRRIYGIQDAEFYLLAGQHMFADNGAHDGDSVVNGKKIVTNCVFYAPEASVLISAAQAATVKFFGCTFINYLPQKTYGAATVTYMNGCKASSGSANNLGTEEAPLVAARIDAMPVEGLVAADGTAIMADVLYEIIGTSETLKVSAAGAVTEYYKVGATYEAWDIDFIQVVDGVLYFDPYLDFSEITEIAAGKVVASGEVTIPAAFESSELCAFSYRDLATGVLYAVGYESTCASDEKLVGEKFYELFNAPDAGYEIVMYQNMRLTKGVPFGAVVEDRKTDSNNRDYFNSFANGSIIWDLNGKTVTVDKNVTNLVRTAAANCKLGTSGEGPTYGGSVVFGFEGFSWTNNFTLKSSAEGGRLVNESSRALFATGEGKSSQIIIEGANLTIDAGTGLVIASHELNYSANNYSDRLQINGGTYISASTTGVMQIAMNTTIKNATLIATNASAGRVVYVHGWRSGRLNAENVIFVSANDAATVLAMASDGSGKQTANFVDCTLIGAAPAVVTEKITAVTYSGTNKVSSPEDLALISATAPEGTKLTYTSVLANGKHYKVCGYFSTSENTVTVHNGITDGTEIWLTGVTYVFADDASALNVVKIDGVWYYFENPVWTATIDGVVVENVCDPKNVNKTVVLSVGGEKELLFFSVTVNGEATYYHNAETVGTDFKALLTPAAAYTYDIKLYHDFEVPLAEGALVIGVEGVYATYKIDANGYTLCFAKTTENKSSYINFKSAYVYFYSSVEDGAFDFGDFLNMACCDKSGRGFFGEPVNDGSTTYGENVTFYFDSVHGYMWSSGLSYIGGTYVQVDDSVSTEMFDGRNTSYPTVIRNSTFIFKKADAIFWGASFGNSGTVVNCSFICENPTNLFLPAGDKDKATTFENCNFYNVIANALGVAVNYNNCSFSLASLDAQTGGYIAYTGNPVTKEIAGKTYTFGAALLAADAVTKIEWIYAEPEYWALGAEASHASVVVDRFFAYGFNTFTVAEENEVVATMIAIKSETLKMGLKLQNQIGMQLFFTNALAELGTEVKVKIGGTEYALSELEAVDGFYRLSASVAPNIAYQAIPVSIVIGEREHTVNLSVGSYATKVLATASYSAVLHNVTYAMVEYVRAFAALNGEEFLPELLAPAGYGDPQTPGEAVSNNEDKTLLSEISFHFAESIELALKGTADAEGMTVKLTLANGHYAYAKVEGGVVLFNNLYVNDFAGEMTIEIGTETYTYSVENYYNAMTGENEVYKGAIAALYNYAYHADLYVSNLENAN